MKSREEILAQKQQAFEQQQVQKDEAKLAPFLGQSSSIHFSKGPGRLHPMAARIPGYEEIVESIASLSMYFLDENSTVYDLKTGTGTLIKQIYQEQIKQFPKYTPYYVAYETDKQQLEEARSGQEEVSIFWNDGDITNQDLFFNGASVIAGIYAMSKMSLTTRLNTLHRIYSSLDKGGAFFLVEHMTPKDAYIGDIFSTQLGIFRDKLGGENYRGRIITLEYAERILKEVGFAHIECFYRNGCIVGLLAIK